MKRRAGLGAQRSCPSGERADLEPPACGRAAELELDAALAECGLDLIEEVGRGVPGIVAVARTSRGGVGAAGVCVLLIT